MTILQPTQLISGENEMTMRAAPSALSWAKLPGGDERYRTEIAAFKQHLRPKVLKANATRNGELVFVVQTEARPELVFYFLTDQHYPNSRPELIVERNGQQVAVTSATLVRWSSRQLLYQICLDTRVQRPKALLWLGLVGIVGLVVAVVFGIVSSLNKTEALPQPTAAVILAPTAEPTITSRRPASYELTARLNLSAADYQGVLSINQIKDASGKNRLAIWYSQSLAQKLSLRFINLSSGSVRTVNLAGSTNGQTIEAKATGCTAGDSCMVVLVETSNNEEVSEPFIISRFSPEKFYAFNIAKINGRAGEVGNG